MSVCWFFLGREFFTSLLGLFSFGWRTRHAKFAKVENNRSLGHESFTLTKEEGEKTHYRRKKQLGCTLTRLNHFNLYLSCAFCFRSFHFVEEKNDDGSVVGNDDFRGSLPAESHAPPPLTSTRYYRKSGANPYNSPFRSLENNWRQKKGRTCRQYTYPTISLVFVRVLVRLSSPLTKQSFI